MRRGHGTTGFATGVSGVTSLSVYPDAASLKCDAAHYGLLNYLAGGTGVNDTLEISLKLLLTPVPGRRCTNAIFAGSFCC